MFITLAILHIFNSSPKIIVKYSNNISKSTLANNMLNSFVDDGNLHEICSINKWTKT